jgi:ABC-type transport system involved in multi-copper enzyme maturation permease subunit
MSESPAAWLRRRLAWSNSVESWQERGGGLLLLGWAGILIWFRGSMTAAVQVLLWALLLAATAWLLRRGGLKLFGPVLFYDLVRVGRRGRYILFRTLYILAMLLLLMWWYWMTTFRYLNGTIPASEMGQFSETFFLAFLIGQMVVVVLLTPPYVAGAIADEKDRQTLEFVLATDLRSREIILGKLASRLVNLLMILLAGLPVLSGIQFLGGVDPDLLLAGFAATALTGLSLACLSMLWSVYGRKGRDAIVLTYLSVFLYVVAATFAQTFLQTFFIGPGGTGANLAEWGFTLPAFLGGESITLGEVVRAANAGNLLSIYIDITMTLERGGRVSAVVPGLLGNFALFHSVLALICVVWSIVRLRPVALKERFNKVQRVPLLRRLLPRLPVGDSPMLWKEVFAEGGVRFNWLGRVLLLKLVALSLIPYAFMIESFVESSWAASQPLGVNTRMSYYGDPWHRLCQEMNIYVRIVGTAVACLLLLAVGVRAAGAVTTERDKQTLDELLTTPLESHNILVAKWLGSILSVRWAMLWLGLIVFPALLIGALHILALPLLAIVWLVYAGLFAAIGLLFSVRARTTLQAAMGTLLTTIFAGGGHWLLTLCCCMPVLFLGGPGSTPNEGRYLFMAQAGITPPFVLGFAGFQESDLEHHSYDPYLTELIFFCILGVLCFGVAAAAVLTFATTEFNRVIGRDFRRPDAAEFAPRLLEPLRMPVAEPPVDRLPEKSWPAEPPTG